MAKKLTKPTTDYRPANKTLTSMPISQDKYKQHCPTKTYIVE